MMRTEDDVKAELSGAYLHAAASRAGCPATGTDRHTDGTGVDAVVRARQRFAAGSIDGNDSVAVPSEATGDEPALNDRGRYPSPLRLDHDNRRRDPERQPAPVLVVLDLPPDPERWLSHRWCLSSGPGLGVGLTPAGAGAPTEANSPQTCTIPEVEPDFPAVIRPGRGDGLGRTAPENRCKSRKYCDLRRIGFGRRAGAGRGRTGSARPRDPGPN